jgi:hypothetical protein
MSVIKFNSKEGYSINDPPVNIIDSSGNYTTVTGNITAVGGTYTGDVSASHFLGDFIGELQVECKNTSGSVIPKGTPVYITGSVGATNVIEVSPADAGNSVKMPAVGLTTEQLAINGTGHITYIGNVQGLNTNSYTIGQTLYVAVGGGLTNVKPTGASELIQNIGKVARVNTNNGQVIVTGPGRSNDVPNTISITGGLTVGGNLVVNGTTTTINSTVTTIDDPIITLGGDTVPTIDDNKDRGIEFKWHNGTSAKVGFFGLDDSTGKFTFIPDATNTSEVFSGSLGTIDVNSVHINGSQIAASNLSNGTTGTGSIVLTTSPTLVTPNIGEATATSISGTNLAISDSTGAYVSIGEISSGSTYISLDGSTGDTLVSAGNIAAMLGTAGVSIVDYGGGITLDSSTGISIGDVSGATSGEYIFIDASGYNANFNGISIIAPLVSSQTYTVSSGGVDLSYSFVSTTTTTATTQINLVQLDKATYRGAKFIIQAVNTTGGKYQLTEINAIHNGNTTVSTATISDINIGGANATYTVDIGGSGNQRMRLRATPTSTQSTVFKVYVRDFSL